MRKRVRLEHTIIFKPDGTAVCLWHEAIALHELGWLALERASTVDFNNHDQKWEVKDLAGRVLFSAKSRSVCLEWEHAEFSR